MIKNSNPKVNTGNKRKIDQLENIKIKKFCESRNTINRIKRKSIKWETTFANLHISDKG